MERKNFLQLFFQSSISFWLLTNTFACSPKTSKQRKRDINMNLQRYGSGKIEKILLSKEEWKGRLSSDEFHILRQEGTEAPFTSPLNDEKREGVFYCAGCQLDLFTSKMKYNSGTGWPSFFTTIPNRFAIKNDYKLILPRKEYHCIRCEGHHGHVFKDGPEPTYERWCNNGIALIFNEEKI